MRAQVMTPKNCPQCSAPVKRHAWEKPNEFNKRTFCSRVCSLKARAMDAKEVLLARRVVTATGCWEWSFGRDKKGYGRWSEHNGETLVHRISYETFVGPIRDGQHVLHHCDNPPCFNPAHLYTGTNDDNVKDRRERDRWGDFRGEKNPRAKITASDVCLIRKSADYQDALAQRFGVTQSTISAIVRRATWKHVP